MKKILSFVLVLCMLISAVPALLLPVLAEEGDAPANKIFSYAEAYPNFVKTVSETGFKFMGQTEAQDVDDAAYKEWLLDPETFKVDQGDYAWKAGSYDPLTGTFELFSRVAFYCDDPKPYQHDVSWITTDSVYQSKLDAYIADATTDGDGSASIWSGHPLMGQNSFKGFTNTGTAAVAVVYTVEEEGTYKALCEELGVDSKSHTLAIFVNDELVWPAGATADKFENWQPLSAPTTAETLNDEFAAMAELSLLAGDKVAFVIGGGSMPLTFVPALEKLPEPEPVKYTFLEEFLAADAGFSYDVSEWFANKGKEPANEPILSNEEYEAWLTDEAFTVNQGNSNWKVGEYVTADGTFTPFTRLLFMAGDTADGHDVNWASTEAVYQKLLAVYIANGYATNDHTSIWNGAALWHLNAGGEDKGNGAVRPGWITSSGTGFASAIQYTVTEAGNYGVQFAEYADTPNGHTMAIAVNGEIIFPANATSSTSTWYVTSNLSNMDDINAVLESVNVKAEVGDTISFLIGINGDACHINPVIVQKPADSIYLTLADPYGINTQAIKTRAGATITLPEYQGDLIFFGWDADGDGKTDYPDGAEITMGEESITLNAVIMTPSKFYENLPTLNADETVSYHGGWTMGAWEKATMTFMPLVKVDSPFLAVQESGPWGTSGGGYYYTVRTGTIVINGAVDNEIQGGTLEEGPYIHSIQKVVDYNGNVQLDFDQLRVDRELDRKGTGGEENPIAAGMAVYVNGEKVWPTDTEDEYFKFITDEIYPAGTYNASADFKVLYTESGKWPFPLDIEVNTGDVIDIRTVQGNSNNWMFYYKPVVTYTSLNETPTVDSTSVGIMTDESNFNLYVYANILEKKAESAVHLEYWTTEPTAEQLAGRGTELTLIEEVNGKFKYAIEGLVAKQMADVFYVRAYTTTEDGTVTVGNVEAVSIQKYAAAALGRDEALDNLLIAMLNYGKAAQDLFGYNTENPANDCLNENQKMQSLDDVSVLADVYANAEGDNKITSVSLILGNQVGLKYMISSVEGATTYELEVSKDADFAESTKIAMTGAWDDRQQKATYFLGLDELGDTVYARAVVDGVAGATLTYSVDSFIIRMQECENTNLWYTINALGYLDQMIEAYQA